MRKSRQLQLRVPCGQSYYWMLCKTEEYYPNIEMLQLCLKSNIRSRAWSDQCQSRQTCFVSNSIESVPDWKRVTWPGTLWSRFFEDCSLWFGLHSICPYLCSTASTVLHSNWHPHQQCRKVSVVFHFKCHKVTCHIKRIVANKLPTSNQQITNSWLG